MNKREARRKGYAAGRRLASQVEVTTLTTPERMMRRILDDHPRELRIFERHLKAVSKGRAEVLNMAFLVGMSAGINDGFKERVHDRSQ